MSWARPDELGLVHFRVGPGQIHELGLAQLGSKLDKQTNEKVSYEVSNPRYEFVSFHLYTVYSPGVTAVPVINPPLLPPT